MLVEFTCPNAFFAPGLDKLHKESITTCYSETIHHKSEGHS